MNDKLVQLPAAHATMKNYLLAGQCTFFRLLLLLLLLPAAVPAQFSYVTNNGAITITGYAGPGGDVTIPATIDGLPVTSIGDNAFYDTPGMISVVIPNSVSSIGSRAFAYCQDLASISLPNGLPKIVEYAFFNCGVTNIVIPDSVKSVESYAFTDCYNLADLTIGAGVTNIGTEAFNGCTLSDVVIPGSVAVIGDSAFTSGYLQVISVEPANPFFQSIDGVLFDHSGTSLIQYPAAKGAGEYVIADGVKFLGPDAFRYASSLTNVTLPNSLQGIGTRAFAQCVNLPAISLPAGLTNLADGAFASCFALTGLVIPSGINQIASGLFASCYSLTNVTITDSVASIGAGAFQQCFSLRNLTLPPAVVQIGRLAFAGTGLRDVRLPDDLTGTADSWFYNCGSLTNVVIGDKLNTLFGVFWGCGYLQSVVIGSGVATIGNYTFSGCWSLSAVYFQGEAPSVSGSQVFDSAPSTVYYLPGTLGWGSTFGGRPTASWVLPSPLILNFGPSFGIQTNAFGFRVSWATNIPVVVEACTNLAAPVWSPLATNILTDGWSYFSDSDWTNYPSRIYRVRSQ